MENEAFVDYDNENIRSGFYHVLIHADSILNYSPSWDVYGQDHVMTRKQYGEFIESCVIVPKDNEFYHDHYNHLWEIFIDNANDILRDIHQAVYGKAYIGFDESGKLEGLLLFGDTYDAEHY